MTAHWRSRLRIGHGKGVREQGTEAWNASDRAKCLGYHCAIDPTENLSVSSAMSPGWREGLQDRVEKAGIPVERTAEPKDEMCRGPTGEKVPKD